MTKRKAALAAIDKLKSGTAPASKGKGILAAAEKFMTEPSKKLPAHHVGKADQLKTMREANAATGEFLVAAEKAGIRAPALTLAEKLAAAVAGATSALPAPLPGEESGVPEILKREPLTDAQRAELDKKVQADLARTIKMPANSKIKNPPARVSAGAKALGMSPTQMQTSGAKPAANQETSAMSSKTTKSKARTAVKGKSAAKAPKAATVERNRYDWNGAEERAAKGTLPHPPDFSAETHKRFRPALAEVVKMARAGDEKGLKAFKWDGSMSSSPKAIMRYRDICLTALRAKKAA